MSSGSALGLYRSNIHRLSAVFWSLPTPEGTLCYVQQPGVHCVCLLSTAEHAAAFRWLSHAQTTVAFRQGEVSCRLWTVAWGTVHTCSFGWDQRGPTYVSTACRLSPVLLHFVSPHTGLLQISVIPDFNCIDFIFISCGLIRSKVNIRFYFTLTFATRDCIMQTEGPPRDTNTVVCVFKA